MIEGIGKSGLGVWRGCLRYFASVWHVHIHGFGSLIIKDGRSSSIVYERIAIS